MRRTAPQENGVGVWELVEALRSFIPFNYEFDTSRSGGFPRRIMDISLAHETLGYEPQTTLVEGLRRTWDWYVQNMDEHLKRKNYFKE